MADIPELKAKVKLDGASVMVGALRGISPEVVDLGRKLAGLAGPLAAIVAGAYLIAKGFSVFIEGLRGATELGEQLALLSAQTGMSAGSLAILQKEFASVGLEAGSVGSRINLMQRAIAGVSETGESTAAVFAEMHLNVQQLRRLAPEEQFNKIRAAIASIPDAARQADAAMKIFGRGGSQMLPLIKDPNSQMDARWAMGDSAKLLDRDASTFARIAKLFGNIGDKFRSFFVGVMDRVGPTLLPILEAFNKLDFTELGQMFGDVIKSALEAVSLIARMFNLIFDGLNKLGIIRDPLAVSSSAGTQVPGAGLTPIGSGHEKEADRLARIGGFIGHTSQGGPLTDIAHATAQTVQKLKDIHQTIVEKSWGISPHPARAAVTW